MKKTNMFENYVLANQNSSGETLKEQRNEIAFGKGSNKENQKIQYVKSFTAKLSQSSSVTKNYYNTLKNYVLSYKKARSRVSWHYDAINLGREYLLKFVIRGKTLCLFFNLDAYKLDKKYKVEKAKGKKYKDVSVLYRIKNDKRCEYAKQLIDIVMNNFNIAKGKEYDDEYRIPYQNTKILIAKGLIKEPKAKVIC